MRPWTSSNGTDSAAHNASQVFHQEICFQSCMTSRCQIIQQSCNRGNGTKDVFANTVREKKSVGRFVFFSDWVMAGKWDKKRFSSRPPSWECTMNSGVDPFVTVCYFCFLFFGCISPIQITVVASACMHACTNNALCRAPYFGEGRYSAHGGCCREKGGACGILYYCEQTKRTVSRGHHNLRTGNRSIFWEWDVYPRPSYFSNTTKTRAIDWLL